MALKNVSSSAPDIENGKVGPPKRLPNADVRPREYLTPSEVDRLIRGCDTVPARIAPSL